MNPLDFFPIKFLNPWALGFLLLVPILILLYFLKLKRPQVWIASTLLWQKVIEDMRVNSPFQRLKRSLLLLLQLLLLLLLIFALARPWLKSLSEKEESLIVVIDTSASMQAREPDGRTRLEHAKEAVESLIDGMSYRNEMALLAFDSRSRSLCPFTANQKRLRKALNQIVASDGLTDPANAFRKAKSLGASRGNPRLLLFSDGSFADPGKVEMPVEFHLVGTPLSNVAITGMDVRRSLTDPKQVELFAAVHNFSETTVNSTMSIYLDNELLDSKALALEPETSTSDVFTADIPGGGVLRVEIDLEDSLPLDNQASLIVPDPQPKKVLLVGNNTYYLEKALASAPDINITSCAMADYPEHADGSFSTVIWSNVEAPAVAAGNNIYLGCVPTAFDVKVDGLIKAPDIADWDNTHPLTRFIDFSNLLIADTFDLSMPKDADVVLSSSKTPIIAVFQRDGRYIVVSGFNVFKSSWPFQVSFVLFLHNCLNYFDAQQNLAGNVNVRVGNVLTAPEQKSTPVVRGPQGTREEMVHMPGGGYTYNGVDRCGVYTIEKLTDAVDRRFAANLLSQSESQLETVSNPISEVGKNTVTTAAAKINREYFRTLLMVALIILFVEWLVYHRRILA